MQQIVKLNNWRISKVSTVSEELPDENQSDEQNHKTGEQENITRDVKLQTPEPIERFGVSYQENPLKKTYVRLVSMEWIVRDLTKCIAELRHVILDELNKVNQ